MEDSMRKYYSPILILAISILFLSCNKTRNSSVSDVEGHHFETADDYSMYLPNEESTYSFDTFFA
jgi:hypothetical protein